MFSIRVGAEGAKSVDGEMSVRKVVMDSTDPVRLGGSGQKIADEVEELTGIESRVTVLGHLQRGGSPTAFDRILSTRFGYKAVDLIIEKKFGHMVSLRGNHIVDAPISDAVESLKLVPRDHDLVKAALSLQISFGAPVR